MRNRELDTGTGCLLLLALIILGLAVVTFTARQIGKLKERKTETIEMISGHTYLLDSDGDLFHSPDCVQCRVKDENIQLRDSGTQKQLDSNLLKN